MQFPITLFLFVAFIICSSEATRKWPKKYPNCHRYDPKLEECLLKAAEEIKPLLIKGIPDLGIPSLDPITIPEILLQQGTQALNFKALLTKITLIGLSNYKFSKFGVEVKYPRFDCAVSISPLRVEGKYNVTGRMLVVPIQGDGTFVAKLGKVDIHFYQDCKLVKKEDGFEYVTPTNTTTVMDASKIKVDIEGLFGNNSELDKIANQAIKDNIDVLFEDLKPTIEKIISEFIEGILFKSLEENFPYDELYPPIP